MARNWTNIGKARNSDAGQRTRLTESRFPCVHPRNRRDRTALSFPAHYPNRRRRAASDPYLAEWQLPFRAPGPIRPSVGAGFDPALPESPNSRARDNGGGEPPVEGDDRPKPPSIAWAPNHGGSGLRSSHRPALGEQQNERGFPDIPVPP